MAIRYKLSDSIESIIGAFGAILFFYSLRTEPISINPIIGLTITLLWLYTFKIQDKMPLFNFSMNILISAVVSGIMTLLFGLATIEQLLSFEFFGSTAIIGLWIAIPGAIIMDKFNIKNLLSRSYIRR